MPAGGRPSLDARFAAFHAENPRVYALLVRFAREVKSRGRVCGIRLLWERMRWELMVTTVGDDFRLNNVFTSRYARLIMREEPDLAGFFETRELRS